MTDNDKVVLGIDCCKQEIVPVSNRLSMYTNRHPNCDGSSWGWIEGCTANICWSNNSAFNSKVAGEIVEKWNNRDRNLEKKG